MEPDDEQEPAAERPAAERGAVRDVGSWSGQNHFSGGGSQTKPHLQATDRASHP